MRIDFLSSTKQGDTVFLGKPKLTNCYLVDTGTQNMPSYTKGEFASEFAYQGAVNIAKSWPGANLFAEQATGRSVRMLFEHQGIAYVVIDDTFYVLGSDGTLTSKGTLLTDAGNIDYDAISNQIGIVDGARVYMYDIATDVFTYSGDEDTPTNITSIAALNTYFILAGDGTQKYYWSALENGLDYDQFSFNAVGTSSTLLRKAVSYLGKLLLLGDTSLEYHIFQDDPDLPFALVGDTYFEYGLAATSSVAHGTQSIYWLGKNKKGGYAVCKSEQFSIRESSDTAFSEALTTYTRVDDAIGMSLAFKAHEFYILYFPTQNVTWCFNSSNKDSVSLLTNTDGNAYSMLCHCFCYGKNLVGDFKSGKIYELNHTTRSVEDDTPILEIITPNIHSAGKYVTINQLILDLNRGVAKTSGQGSAPLVMVNISMDGGNTFGHTVNIECGSLGEYLHRAILAPVATERNIVIKVRYSEPNIFTLLRCYAEMRVNLR